MKRLFAGVLIAILGLSTFTVAKTVSAAYGLGETAGAAGLKINSTPQAIAGQIIGSALSLVGVVFFILMIYAGITWMVSRGNEEQSKKALRTIIAAVIGLIIVLASYAITNFVFTSIGSTDAEQSEAVVTSSTPEITIPE